MAYMKSLTVSGQTYQVKDPEAVSVIQGQALTPTQQANARENLGILSTKELLDKLCPSFAERGAVVTCEPVEGYPLEITAEDGATITRCGKNVFGGNALVDALKRTDLGGGVTVDESNKTVTFDANLMDRSHYPFTRFKENTQYTFIFCGYNTATAGVTNMRVVYTDGSTDYFYFGSIDKPTPANEVGYVCLTTQVGKTVDYLRLSLQSGLVVLYYDQCGVFEGDVLLEDFEAYKTETLSFGEPIYAWSGVNTLWANTGDITVKGKADPVAILNRLTGEGN